MGFCSVTHGFLQRKACKQQDCKDTLHVVFGSTKQADNSTARDALDAKKHGAAGTPAVPCQAVAVAYSLCRCTAASLCQAQPGAVHAALPAAPAAAVHAAPPAAAVKKLTECGSCHKLLGVLRAAQRRAAHAFGPAGL